MKKPATLRGGLVLVISPPCSTAGNVVGRMTHLIMCYVMAAVKVCMLTDRNIFFGRLLDLPCRLNHRVGVRSLKPLDVLADCGEQVIAKGNGLLDLNSDLYQAVEKCLPGLGAAAVRRRLDVGKQFLKLAFVCK